MSRHLGLLPKDTTDQIEFDKTNLPVGVDQFALRCNAEKQELQTRYHGVILDRNAATEMKLWARVHSRRMSVLWPEEHDLLEATDTAEVSKLKQAIADAEVEVAAFLVERNLDF